MLTFKKDKYGAIDVIGDCGIDMGFLWNLQHSGFTFSVRVIYL